MVGLDDLEARNNEAMGAPDEAAASEQGPVSDADWLRSRTNRVLELVEDDDMPSAPVSAPTAKRPSPKPQAEEAMPEVPTADAEADPPLNEQAEGDPVDDDAEENKIRETGRLYLRNLHYEVKEDEIRAQFSKHGSLEEVSESLRFFFDYTPCNDERQDRDN